MKVFRITLLQIVVTLFAVLVMLVAIAAIVMFLLKHYDTEKGDPWPYAHCSFECDNNSYKRTPLVVISLDGFSREYLNQRIVRTLEQLAECGTEATYMYPSYPSKTFPNHYTMATGLYPESHGIVDNSIYDENIVPDLINVRRAGNPKYFQGEPIWNVLERQNLKTACIFWAGCDLPINGQQPTYNIKYNRSYTSETRMDQVIKWLLLPEEKRPALIMAYLNEPDTTRHFHKNSSKIDGALEDVEHALRHLLTSLHQARILNCINLIILSDHGMKDIEKRFYLDDYLNMTNVLATNGAISRIHVLNRTEINEVLDVFMCANNGTDYRVYNKRNLPKRYHYTGTNRVGDIILDGREGTLFYTTQEANHGLTSDHGYDMMLPSMRTIFYAHGPNIARKYKEQPFQNVELYNLFADLTQVSDFPQNNGTKGRLSNILIELTSKIEQRGMNLQDCHFDEIKKSDGRCDPQSLIGGPLTLCSFVHCSNNIPKTVAIYNTKSKQLVAVAMQVSKGTDRKDVNLIELIDEHLIGKSSTQSSMVWFKSFLKENIMYLRWLTLQYAKLYGDLVLIFGTISDHNDDGLADNDEVLDRQQIPSHIFYTIMRCNGSSWLQNRMECATANALQVMSLVLPNVDKDLNCLAVEDYLTSNLARLKDIELLSRIQFFTANSTVSDHESLLLRTYMPYQIWDTVV